MTDLAARQTRAIFLLIVVVAWSAIPRAQERIEPHGDFVEPLSSLAFPPQVLGWDRTDILKYPDPGGHSITYQFRMNGSLATATIYIYPQAPPIPPSLDEQYSETLKGLLTLGQGAEVVSEDPSPVHHGDQVIERRFATLLFRNGFGSYREPAISFLILSKHGSLWLKWRITIPASAPHEITEHLADLTKAFVPAPAR